MGLLDRIKNWLQPPPFPGISAAEERIPLNPLQMLVAESVAKHMGWNNGVTSLTREQYERLSENVPSFRSLSEGLSTSSDLKVTAHQVAAALATLYTKATETRKAMIQEVDEISNFYMLEIIVRQIVEGALSPDITTDEIFELTSDKENLAKELYSLQKKFQLNKMAKEWAQEIIRYGEYTISTVVKTNQTSNYESLISRICEAENLNPEDSLSFKKDFMGSEVGLIQLNDTVDQTEVVAISKNGETDYYLNMTAKDGKVFLQRRHRSEYVQFRLDQQRVRIDLHKEFSFLPPKQKEEISKLPRYIRVGQSFVHSMIPKFRELELLEKLAPATKLSKMSSGTIIGLQVPQGYTLQKALEACKTVEGIINRKLAIQEDTGRISVESILTSVGRAKVIPIFGETGNTKIMETKTDEPDSLASDIQNLRKVILDGIGIPFELIFSAAEGDTKKGDVLKRYDRYLNLLRSVQRAVKEGLYQIASIHLAAKGIPFETDDIKVSFKNKIVELSNLDKLEFIDTSVQMLKNTQDFVEGLMGAEGLQEYVDMSAFREYLKDQLRLLGLESLVLMSPSGKILKLSKAPEEPGEVPTEPEEQPGENEPPEVPTEPTEEPEEPESPALPTIGLP